MQRDLDHISGGALLLLALAVFEDYGTRNGCLPFGMFGTRFRTSRPVAELAPTQTCSIRRWRGITRCSGSKTLVLTRCMSSSRLGKMH
jgi:hypothetical protein